MKDKSFVHIRAQGLPGIFPNEDLSGSFWQKAPRIISDSDFSITIPTDNKYQLVNDPSFRIRNIQVQIFNKYEIWVFADEDTNINLWDKVLNLWIDVNDGNGGETITYKALVLNDIVSTKEQLSGTHKYRYTIKFADINTNNYGGEDPVSNLLESRSVFENKLFGAPNSFQSLYSLEFNNSGDIDNEFAEAWNSYYGGGEFFGGGGVTGKYRINTAIRPIERTITRLTKPLQMPDGRIKQARIIKIKVKTLVFYLGEIDKNITERYLPYCWDGGNAKTVLISPDTSELNSIESIDTEVSVLDEAADLYEVIINFPYKIIDFSPH